MSKTKQASPSIGSPDTSVCAHANLRKAMRIVSRAYDAALKPSGLRATQFTLLAVLKRRGEIPLVKLAEALMMDRTTLTRNLKPLEKKGWLAIGRESDARIRLISITELGRNRLTEAMPLWMDTHSRVTKGLGEPRFLRLIDDLAALAKVA